MSASAPFRKRPFCFRALPFCAHPGRVILLAGQLDLVTFRVREPHHVFVQDLSQLKAVYPRWQSFLANTSQQFFWTADFETAR
jgi:hypothetical protein